MILIMGFLIYLASYLLIALEAKFNKIKLLFMIIFKVLIHMLPLILYNDANAFC